MREKTKVSSGAKFAPDGVIKPTVCTEVASLAGSESNGLCVVVADRSHLTALPEN